jgi:Bacterial regulatory protein, arsR family
MFFHQKNLPLKLPVYLVC